MQTFTISRRQVVYPNHPGTALAVRPSQPTQIHGSHLAPVPRLVYQPVRPITLIEPDPVFLASTDNAFFENRKQLPTFEPDPPPQIMDAVIRIPSTMQAIGALATHFLSLQLEAGETPEEALLRHYGPAPSPRLSLHGLSHNKFTEASSEGLPEGNPSKASHLDFPLPDSTNLTAITAPGHLNACPAPSNFGDAVFPASLSSVPKSTVIASAIDHPSLAQATQKIDPKGCNCKQSMCLKLYCPCFSNSGFCSRDCSCADCRNSVRFADLRNSVARRIEELNPFAFRSRFAATENQSAAVVNARGCTCRRSQCSKHYCDCFKAGLNCSEICKCWDCSNHKVPLVQADVDKYRQKIKRRRQKRTLYSMFGLQKKQRKRNTHKSQPISD